MNNDQAIEQEIQAKGKTAPRVTPESIKAVIASEHYFTANDGAQGAFARDNQDFSGIPVPDALSLLTFCVLVLKNGFTVVGKSACASPENFDADIGRKVAFGEAIQQIWPLEGYLLKHRLSYAAIPGEVGAPPLAELVNTMPAHQQRVITERDELADKTSKLAAFHGTPTFDRLPEEEQVRLARQLEAMKAYHQVLAERIASFPPA